MQINEFRAVGALKLHEVANCSITKQLVVTIAIDDEWDQLEFEVLSDESGLAFSIHLERIYQYSNA